MTTDSIEANERLLEELQADCIRTTKEEVWEALTGDADIAGEMLIQMDGRNRGYWSVILGMHQLMEPEAYRVLLEGAWSLDHQYVQHNAFDYPLEGDEEEEDNDDGRGSFYRMKEVLQECFEYAAFDIPDDLPETLTVYRGCYGLDAYDTACGFSWTLSPETGAWFANRKPFRDIFAVAHYDEAKGPCLVKATINRSDVVLYTNDREEQEVVTFAVKPHDVERIPHEERALTA